MISYMDCGVAQGVGIAIGFVIGIITEHLIFRQFQIKQGGEKRNELV